MEDIWDSISDAVPSYVVGALIILLVGWIVAWLLSKLVQGAVRRSGIGRRLGRHMGGSDTEQAEVAGAAGRVAFYLVMLFVVIAVLDRLQLRLATAPMNELLDGIFGFIPNLIGAVVLFLLAFILAKIARTVVFEFARTMGLDDRLHAATTGERVPVASAQQTGDSATSPRVVSAPPTSPQRASSPLTRDERYPLARGLAEVAYVLVFLFFLPAILDALELGGLLEPVNELLTTVFAFIPNLVAAGLILVIGWFIARIVSRIVTAFLTGAGFDGVPTRLGFGTVTQTVTVSGGWTPSRVVGTVVFAVLMWFTLIQALEVLRFDALALLASALLVLAGRIVLGLLIIAIGLWLARMAARSIRASGVQQPNLLAIAAQAAIVLLFGAMGLREMGLANSIINLAFAILFGAIGIAVALAFGLGGRGAAGRLADRWVGQTQTGQFDVAARPPTDGGPAPERSNPPI